MAKIGVRKMVYAKWTADDTYTDGAQFGKISTFNFTPTTSSVKDYGDDVVAEVANEMSGGTISIEGNQVTLEEKAFFLGHTYSAENGLEVKADDQAPYVGVGAMSVEMVGGVKQYVGKWYKKLMFHEPNDENTTKQENISFAHTTLEADVVPQEGDKGVSITKLFTTEAAALAWLKEKAGISAQGQTGGQTGN